MRILVAVRSRKGRRKIEFLRRFGGGNGEEEEKRGREKNRCLFLVSGLLFQQGLRSSHYYNNSTTGGEGLRRRASGHTTSFACWWDSECVGGGLKTKTAEGIEGGIYLGELFVFFYLHISSHVDYLTCLCIFIYTNFDTLSHD